MIGDPYGDITGDGFATTRRRAIVAAVLRRSHRPLVALYRDARAILDALDEDYDDGPYEMTVEQEIRRDALASAAVLLAPLGARGFPGQIGRLVEMWLRAASEGADLITNGGAGTVAGRPDAAGGTTSAMPPTGYGPAAEPTPSPDVDGAADGHGEAEPCNCPDLDASTNRLGLSRACPTHGHLAR